MNLSCFNMKDNKAPGHKSLFFFGDSDFKIDFSNYFGIQTIYIFYMLPTFYYLFTILTQKSVFLGTILSYICLLHLGSLWKKCVSCIVTRLKNVVILLKQFYRTQKEFWSMTISNDLGPPKPKLSSLLSGWYQTNDQCFCLFS